ncbi:ABC transporter ATP-binding protein [Rubrimonas sp.]|uniref:ABC transporter ATP-binding protein n=1 Tax=Rubrimonas sp. TaxID=2036015 RepID=UPI002FDD6F60
MTAKLDVAGLSVTFGEGSRAVHAAQDVTFSVAKGEAFGLIGESGSGKSTVLRAVAGLNAYAGVVALDGAPARRPRPRAFFRRVQMVFQDPYGSLHPRKMVRSVLMEPMLIHGIGDCDRRVAETLVAVGLSPDYAYRYPHQLSGGQRQRVAIARCLVVEPEVLLLDEPTSALDVSVQAGVLNLLDGLRRARGLTYVLVSHDLRVVAHLCERIAVMTEGRVVEQIDADAIRAARCRHPYTRALLASSRGWTRSAASSDTAPA